MNKLICDVCGKEILRPQNGKATITRKTNFSMGNAHFKVEVAIFTHDDICTECQTNIPLVISKKMVQFSTRERDGDWQDVEPKYGEKP